MNTHRQKLERDLEDYYSQELERTGMIETLALTRGNIDYQAKAKYGRIDASTTGAILCDEITRFLDSLEWD